MATPNPSSKNHVRSISLPSRTHPSTARIQDELNKLGLKCSEPVSDSLFRLEELYVCLDEFLSLPSTQQALPRESNDIWDGSVKILDICGIARDLVAEVKEHVRDLLSAIRRRKCDPSLADYCKFRKKVKKDAKRIIATVLKQMDNKSKNQDPEPEASEVVRVLREVNQASSNVFKSLMMFLSGTTSKTRQSKWSVISKLVHRVDCEETKECDDANELASVDSLLRNLCTHSSNEGADSIEKMHQTVQKQLEDLEMSIGSIEDGLDCVFRRLIKSRASLLNIISQ